MIRYLFSTDIPERVQVGALQLLAQALHMMQDLQDPAPPSLTEIVKVGVRLGAQSDPAEQQRALRAAQVTLTRLLGIRTELKGVCFSLFGLNQEIVFFCFSDQNFSKCQGLPEAKRV